MKPVTALLVTAGAIWILAIAIMPAHTHAQMTTVERVAGSGWWPTKAGVATGLYAGTATCARCHQRIARVAGHNGDGENRSASRGVRVAPRASRLDLQDRRSGPRNPNNEWREPLFRVGRKEHDLERPGLGTGCGQSRADVRVRARGRDVRGPRQLLRRETRTRCDARAALDRPADLHAAMRPAASAP